MNSRYTSGLIALLAIAGCSHPTHSIVGTWTSGADDARHIASQTITYKADGTFEQDASMSDPGRSISVDFKSSGTWKEVSEDHYQIQFTDIAMSNLAAPTMDTGAANQMMQQMKPQLLKDANQNPDFTTAWSGNDTFNIGSTTFHRKP
jgi:hypothetical protein